MDWTHAIITAAGKMTELANPNGMTLTVPVGCSAVSRTQINTWCATYTNLNGICAHFGWTNETGTNYANS